MCFVFVFFCYLQVLDLGCLLVIDLANYAVLVKNSSSRFLLNLTAGKPVIGLKQERVDRCTMATHTRSSFFHNSIYF